MSVDYSVNVKIIVVSMVNNPMRHWSESVSFDPSKPMYRDAFDKFLNDTYGIDPDPFETGGSEACNWVALKAANIQVVLQKRETIS